MSCHVLVDGPPAVVATSAPMIARPTLALVWLIMMAACNRSKPAPEPAPAPPPIAIADEAAWRQALLDERTEAATEMRTSATSPLAAVERHIVPGATYVTGDATSVMLTGDPRDGAAAVFRPGTPAWTWEPLQPGLIATRPGGEPVPAGPVPSAVVLGLGRFSLIAQPVESTFVIQVFDGEAPARKDFTGLVHYEPDPGYAIVAAVEPATDASLVTMPTSIGLEKSFRRYGTLRFTVDGQPVKLTAYQPVGASDTLFIPFRDATSGQATYGAGRYLDVAVPAGTPASHVVLDFNRAYSPMCSFSSAYNCPLPPVENHLEVAIEAGEKTYPHPPAGQL
jgi:hypothetical protein